MDTLWIIIGFLLPFASALWFPFEDSLTARRRAAVRREAVRGQGSGR
jgi:hypothetical protein